MRIGSLFSGAGGLDMAVEEAFGAQVAWHCEVDPAASKVLAARWPSVPNFGDITKAMWPVAEPVDILCGGYPCQPFSTAGQRKGAADERHLWPYFAEAIRHIRPRYVVLENVAGHRSMGFDRVLADLAGIGYDAQWCSVRACDVGAPHRRERIFVLATDAQRAGREWRRQVQQRRTSIDTAGNSAGAVALLPTPRKSDGDGGANPLHRAERMDDVETRIIRLLQTPSTADGEGSRKYRGGNRSDEPLLPGQAVEMATNWGKYEPAIRRWESLTRIAPSPTEPNTKGNPRLAAALSEWMMGWPGGWVTAVPGISRNDQLRIIGNGVVPQQAIAALRWLLTVSERAA